MPDFQNHPSPRTYTVPELARDLKWVTTRLRQLWAIWVGRRLSPALREQIIVAVAQTNACRMCEHAHVRHALAAGVSNAELAALENMDEHAFDRATWLAVGHARSRTKADFAADDGDELKVAVVGALGPQTCRDVEDVARAMTVANRIANTLNALPDRRRGSPVPGSRLADELVINLLFLPGAWLGTLIAAIRQRKSPLAVWRQARSGRNGSSSTQRSPSCRV
ncbi:MAG: carboxymuconolactone decarboxylase family protein [Myxococcales bacterium]|nr:carboxymuconolactone decarboxylase family protein [Myxococcales bacterium]